MEHESKQNTHEVKHNAHKVPNTKVVRKSAAFGKWSISIAIVLLLVIAFQMSSLNTKLTSMDSKLGTMEEFFNKVNELNEQVQAAQPPAAPPSQPTQPTAQPTVVDVEGIIDDDAVQGDSNAPVTIVEWSDFECPFCKRFYNDAYQQIKTEYIDTGKVKFVYRDFPLSFHKNSQKAAEAAECAGEQGKFYEMHDKLFESGVGGVDTYKKYATEIGLDTSAFNSCLDSGKMAAEVAKDMQEGQTAGIRGTPGFVINGQLLSGAQPFAAFKQVIDAELAK